MAAETNGDELTGQVRQSLEQRTDSPLKQLRLA
jgi:hypothetical protein